MALLLAALAAGDLALAATRREDDRAVLWLPAAGAVIAAHALGPAVSGTAACAWRVGAYLCLACVVALGQELIALAADSALTLAGPVLHAPPAHVAVVVRVSRLAVASWVRACFVAFASTGLYLALTLWRRTAMARAGSAGGATGTAALKKQRSGKSLVSRASQAVSAAADAPIEFVVRHAADAVELCVQHLCSWQAELRTNMHAGTKARALATACLGEKRAAETARWAVHAATDLYAHAVLLESLMGFDMCDCNGSSGPSAAAGSVEEAREVAAGAAATMLAESRRRAVALFPDSALKRLLAAGGDSFRAAVVALPPPDLSAAQQGPNSLRAHTEAGDDVGGGDGQDDAPPPFVDGGDEDDGGLTGGGHEGGDGDGAAQAGPEDIAPHTPDGARPSLWQVRHSVILNRIRAFRALLPRMGTRLEGLRSHCRDPACRARNWNRIQRQAAALHPTAGVVEAGGHGTVDDLITDAFFGSPAGGTRARQ